MVNTIMSTDDEQDNQCTYYSIGSYGVYPIWFYKRNGNYFYQASEYDESKAFENLEDAIEDADFDFGCTDFGFWRTVEEANKHAEWLLTQAYSIEI